MINVQRSDIESNIRSKEMQEDHAKIPQNSNFKVLLSSYKMLNEKTFLWKVRMRETKENIASFGPSEQCC